MRLTTDIRAQFAKELQAAADTNEEFDLKTVVPRCRKYVDDDQKQAAVDEGIYASLKGIATSRSKPKSPGQQTFEFFDAELLVPLDHDRSYVRMAAMTWGQIGRRRNLIRKNLKTTTMAFNFEDDFWESVEAVCQERRITVGQLAIERGWMMEPEPQPEPAPAPEASEHEAAESPA